MRTRKCGMLRDERGVELVEFAFVLPLFALLLIGGIEFGRAFYTYNILTKSVRTAARYLSAGYISSNGGAFTTGNAIDATTKTKVKDLAVFGNINGTGLPVIKGLTTGSIPDPVVNFVNVVNGYPAATYVTVSANYSYRSLFKFILPGSTFQPSVTMLFVGTITP